MPTKPTRRRGPHFPELVGPASLVAGFLATATEVHPTGHTAWDIVLAGLLAAGCIWAAAAAPWWANAAVALGAGIVAGRLEQWPLVVVAAVALGASVYTRQRREPLLSSAAAALSITVLSRLDDGPFFGATAAFGLTLIVSLSFVGIAHHRRVRRRRAWVVVAALAGFMVVCTAGFGIAALLAKDDISTGNQAARLGIDALKAGDYTAATSYLAQAEQAYDDADAALGTPWALLGRAVPVVAQNRAVAVRVVTDAAEVAGRATAAAEQIDPEQLRVQDGQIDLAAVEALATPVDELEAAILDLQATLDEPVSGWVPSAITDRLDDVGGDVDSYARQADNLSQAVHAAPGLLGADGPRRYFVAFSTPAESRSIGGFIGNYAVLEVDQGRLALTEFGRSDDLRLAAPVEGMDIDLPLDFTRRYGAFNFRNEVTGLVEPMAWKNIGITPDFPTMTDITQQMWAATFDTEIDGAILLDPFTVAQLLEYTGPQQIAGYDTPIDSSNAADFILREQYKVFDQQQETRVDQLEVLAEQTISALLAGALPAPIDLARDLGPYAREHRLMMWTDVESEQAMFDAVGLSGRFPVSDGSADFGITFNNGGPNKMDAYLEHTISAATRLDDDLGVEVVDVTIELRNTAPSTGLPTYVTGNSAGEPEGTVLLYLSAYGVDDVVDAQRDGEPLGVETDLELGANVAAAFVNLGFGETTSVTFTFEAPGPEPAAGWAVFLAPTAQRVPSES